MNARTAVSKFIDDNIDEAAKALVENPEWDFDGASESAKDYYRIWARKMLNRLKPQLEFLYNKRLSK